MANIYTKAVNLILTIIETTGVLGASIMMRQNIMFIIPLCCFTFALWLNAYNKGRWNKIKGIKKIINIINNEDIYSDRDKIIKICEVLNYFH